MKDLVQRPWGDGSIDFLRENPRSSLWAYMGSGKTPIVLTLLDMLYLTGDLTRPSLVLGPLRVARDTWTGERDKWTQFKDMTISPIVGELHERVAAMRRDAQIYTCNYEQLPWLVEQYGQNWPFQCVIADEATRLKGYRTKQGTQRAGLLATVSHKSERWHNLTGSPSPNGYKDLWGQQFFIDRGQRLGKTYTAFMDRWFKPSWDGHGVEPLPYTAKEINEILADCCLTVDPRDYYDIAEPIVTPVEVRMSKAQMKIYKELEREMFAQLEDGTNIEVFNAAALTNKCLQFANGAVYTEHPAWKAVHNEKLDALASIIEESAGAQVLVAYAFRSDLARILAKFKGAVDISKPDGYRAFRHGEKQIGCAHPASMGHGIDGLQENTNILIRFGHDWNLEWRLQMKERIGPIRQMQSGLSRPVYEYDIITAGTLDEDVQDRHNSKLSVMDILLKHMKVRK